MDEERLAPMGHGLLASGIEERASQFGPETLTDQEMLTRLLRHAPDIEAVTAARALMARWQGLAAIVSADLEAISDIIGRPAALDLKFLQAVLLRLASGFMVQREVITSSASLEAYLRVRLSGLPREQFRVLFLDKRNRLIADEALGDGTIDHAPVYPREIVRRALQLDACALILAHNHPSGDATPSEADIAMTKEIVKACNVMGIKVHDHVVVGGRDVVSLRALGCF